jgi:hypothetical protein
MKNYHLMLLGFCLLLSSCAVPINYIGDRLTPTSSVEIFYSTHDVKKEYKVIGHFTCVNNLDQEDVKAQLINYARTVGADAIVITGTDATKDNQAAYVNADALKYTN